MQVETQQLALPSWRDGGPGVLTTDGGVGLQLMTLGDECAVNSAEMSARARVCTNLRDRQGDVIEPSGVHTENYQFAPSVMFEHGFSGVPFPIAKSVDLTGALTVQYMPDEDALYARAFFSDKNELSAQMFGLIEEGFLRATSIHVHPREGGFTQYPGGTHVQQSDLLEWSWCTIGVNPEAYAKSLVADSKLSETLALQLESANRILQRGTIGNRQLIPSLAKCLRAIQPPRQSIVQGHSVIEDAMGTKTLTAEQMKKLTPIGLAKAMVDMAQWDDATATGLKSMAKSLTGDETMAKADVTDGTLPTDDAAAGDPTESTTDTLDAPSGMPAGAQFISDFHDNLGSLIENADKALAQVENPQVKEGVQPIIDELRTHLSTLEGLFTSAYPDQPALSGASEPADAESMAKSWLAQPTSQYKLAGLAQRLSQASTLPQAKAKALIAGTVRDLQLISSQAKSFKPQSPKDMVPKAEHEALKAQYAKLEGTTQKLMEVLNGQPAAL